LSSPILDEVAEALEATTRQVALAWLLQRSPNLLVIAGTSSVDHLHDNLKAADLKLLLEMVNKLNSIAATADQEKSE
jgi:aryl-alcohol dehydrogenase-like predicted oxidoreductase